MSDNLPDDVTPGDIDRHYGAPNTRRVHGTVEVAVTIETQYWDDTDQIRQELMEAYRRGETKGVLNARIEEID